jgi:hypothetical protein
LLAPTRRIARAGVQFGQILTTPMLNPTDEELKPLLDE